ncbi:hypothetical protein AVEN_56111-1 [Araneus ventricosus]|uniref:Uncharacterized protein n=1 Tax=Araneus ventricosus TaxID=182803 RepID=A0A4Y2GUI2_ARAVE|nr:hypothetical protein AVEN_56111-1 [Araneus ventricosus]
MQFHKLFSGQLLAEVFLKLIDIIFHSHELGQRHNLVDCRLHKYCLKPLKVTFGNALRPMLLPSRSEGSLCGPFRSIFDYLDAGKDVVVINPKLFESKTGTFIVS